jgi:WhiB family redox-sensing transcriptional regulator
VRLFAYAAPDTASKGDDESWAHQGACAQIGGDLWFPERGDNLASSAAKEICRTVCPVRDKCLAWALEHERNFGIYGGLTVPERRALRRGSA